MFQDAVMGRWAQPASPVRGAFEADCGVKAGGVALGAAGRQFARAMDI